MRDDGEREIRDSLTASLIASPVGAAVCATLIGSGAIGVLGVIGFFFFGVFSVVTPLFLIMRIKSEKALGVTYLALTAAGAAGGYGLSAASSWMIVPAGGQDAEASILLIGALSGVATSISWIVCHSMLAARK